jgi:hypothetical protein
MDINWSIFDIRLTSIDILGVVIDLVNTNVLHWGTRVDFTIIDGGRHRLAMNSCISETGLSVMDIDPYNPDTVYGASKKRGTSQASGNQTR